MHSSKLVGRGLATGALTLALGVTACGGEQGGGGGGGAQGGGGQPRNVQFDMTIGDLVPLSGDLSVFGPPGQAAADLAVQEINQAAQQAGVRTNVRVEHADTETQAQAAVQGARQLISGGANCLAGAWASASTLAVAESVASRQRVPLISPASTSAEITALDDNGLVWRTAPSDNLQARALADTVEQELGGTNFTLSLAARNDAYGQGFIQQFGQAWQQKGGRVTGPVLYDPEQPNYNSEAQEIVSGNPNAYVIIDFPETYARMGAALERTGNFDASKMFTADGLAADEIPEEVPAQSLAGTRGTRPGTPEEGQVVQQFSQAYRQTGEERGTFDAQNFDAVMLCYLAAVAAGKADGQAISQNLQAVSGPPGTKYDFTQLPQAIKALAAGEDIDFQGVTGPIDFDQNGDPTTATYEVYRYGPDDGQLEVLRQFQAQQGG
ncbi:MAG TPA: ABC transporter substrate-binding protein [Solirubrobacteraceae bacterium]|nr:ABC transporter substrate-binding protein [Solirubrobacteraceae bacterium]